MSKTALTLKQERFVTAWHETGNKSEAYRQAYNCESMSEATINNKAYELSLNGEIRARLEAVQQESAERHNVTIAEVTKMHRDAYQALNPHAMTAAANNLAKLHGLITDKAKIETNLPTLSELSDEELDRRILELAEKAGLSIAIN
ncbi:MAG: terminase small subunit [Thiothrix sp.]|nr:MAG: terminase small subunit [Thiothrix sp.]